MCAPRTGSCIKEHDREPVREGSRAGGKEAGEDGRASGSERRARGAVGAGCWYQRGMAGESAAKAVPAAASSSRGRGARHLDPQADRVWGLAVRGGTYAMCSRSAPRNSRPAGPVSCASGAPRRPRRPSVTWPCQSCGGQHRATMRWRPRQQRGCLASAVRRDRGWRRRYQHLVTACWGSCAVLVSQQRKGVQRDGMADEDAVRATRRDDEAVQQTAHTGTRFPCLQGQIVGCPYARPSRTRPPRQASLRTRASEMSSRPAGDWVLVLPMEHPGLETQRGSQLPSGQER